MKIEKWGLTISKAEVMKIDTLEGWGHEDWNVHDLRPAGLKKNHGSMETCKVSIGLAGMNWGQEYSQLMIIGTNKTNYL